MVAQHRSIVMVVHMKLLLLKDPMDDPTYDVDHVINSWLNG